MNFKHINKLTFYLIFILLLSCKSVNFVTQKDINSVKTSEIFELDSKISTIGDLSNNDYVDFYNPLIINNLDFLEEKYKKKISLKKFNKIKDDINPLSSFLINNQLILFNSESQLNFYDINDYKLVNTIDIKLNYLIKDLVPSSIANINKQFYVSYSNGKVLNFDIDGNVKWELNFNDILKTPLKIHNDNIIVVLTNKIISIDTISSKTNWEYTYETNKSLNALGGKIVNLRNLLFFILPNHARGQIDTIIGENDEIMLVEKNYKSGMSYFSNSLHVYNNILSSISQNKFLSSFNFGKDNILIDNHKLSNLNSFSFYNNSLIYLDSYLNIKAINILNGNLYWQVNFEKILKKDDSIIKVSSYLNNLIIFFKSGQVLNLDITNGKLINNRKITNKDILNIQSLNSYLLLSHTNGTITVY